MSVTITRHKARELADKTVVRASQSLGRATHDEVTAFRNVIETSPAFARGNNEVDGVCCPMFQTRFQMSSSGSISLAYAWDDVTRAEGLAYGHNGTVIHVNPYTS